jgi:site-specific recombinase XerD
MSNCYKEFLGYMKDVQGVDNKTLVCYEKNLKDFNEYIFGGKADTTFEEIANLKVSEIQTKWLNRLKDEKGYKSNTLNNRIITLTRLYTYMVGENYTTVNKGKLIPHYKGDKKVKKEISTDDYISLLEELRKNRDKNFTSLRNWFMVEFFLATGLRRAEIIALDIEDVNILTGEIKVTRKYDEGVKFGKERIEYLPEILLDDLHYYLSHRLDIETDSDAFFISTHKKRMCASNINKLLNKIADNNGMKIHPHMLRAGFSSNTINSGRVESYEVAEAMGHSNKTTTLNYYHKSNTEVLKKVANSNMIFDKRQDDNVI